MLLTPPIFGQQLARNASEPASRKQSDDSEFTYDKKGNWIYKRSGDKVKTRQVFYIGDDYQSITSKIDSFRSALITKDNGTFRPSYEEGVVMGYDIMQGQGFQKILDYLENKKKTSGKIEKIIFSDRAYYIGEVSNGVPNGEGKTIVRDKLFYNGQYVDVGNLKA